MTLHPLEKSKSNPSLKENRSSWWFSHYNFKIKNAQRFLEKGDKVKFTVRFKGREMQHTNLGKDLMQRIIQDIIKVGKVEVQPKFEGKQIIMIIQPL